MSNLLSQASLVMIPSGYKEDVVYSQIPTSGAGDLSFTRASNGTRINSAGLVEVCPWNLAQYSEDLSNAVWTKLAATITTNATTAPNGTTTADKLIEDTTNNLHRVGQGGITIETNQVYTFSFYAKAGERNELELQRINTSGTVFNSISSTTVNLALGTIIVGSNVTNSSIQSVGDGWYKISVSLTAIASGSGGLNIGLVKDGNLSYLGNGTSGAYIWGFQVNIGSTAKPYFPTTDRLNVPRLTYQNGGGGCPSLLLEKQSTNLVTYSEDFTQTPWTKGDVTIISNNTISPDGTQNADKFILDATNSGHIIYQSIPNQNSGYYTVSCYVKYGNVRYFSTRSQTGGVVSATQFYDLQNGVVVGGSSDANITSVGNGWYQITLKCLSSNSTDVQYIVHCFTTSSTSETCTSDGSLYGYIWGAQAEASSYPTSYIPTTTSSATRVADTGTTSLSSSIVNASEGVLFLDYQPLNVVDAYPVDFQLQYNGSNAVNGVTIYHDGSTPAVTVRSGGTTIFSAFLTATTAGTRNKIALAYKGSDYAVYQNGVQKATQSSGVAPAALNELRLSDGNRNFSINEALVFPTRLTNAELASLTTI